MKYAVHVYVECEARDEWMQYFHSKRKAREYAAKFRGKQNTYGDSYVVTLLKIKVL